MIRCAKINHYHPMMFCQLAAPECQRCFQLVLFQVCPLALLYLPLLILLATISLFLPLLFFTSTLLSRTVINISFPFITYAIQFPCLIRIVFNSVLFAFILITICSLLTYQPIVFPPHLFIPTF